MSYMRRIFVLIVAGLVLTGLTTSVALAQDPVKGKELWEKEIWQCQSCHGPAGEGLWAGPRAGDGKTAQEWIDQVRNPKRNMPRFSPEQVSDEQITDMHAYVESLPKPDSFTPADAPLLGPPDELGCRATWTSPRWRPRQASSSWAASSAVITVPAFLIDRLTSQNVCKRN